MTDRDHSKRFISPFLAEIHPMRILSSIPSSVNPPMVIEQKIDSNRMFIIPTIIPQSGPVSGVCHMLLERRPLWRQIASDIPLLSIHRRQINIPLVANTRPPLSLAFHCDCKSGSLQVLSLKIIITIITMPLKSYELRPPIKSCFITISLTGIRSLPRQRIGTKCFRRRSVIILFLAQLPIKIRKAL